MKNPQLAYLAIKKALHMSEPQNYRWQNRKEYKGKGIRHPSPLTPLLLNLAVVPARRPPHNTAKTFFIAAILLWENDNVGTGIVLYYSIVYNSVVQTYVYAATEVIFY